MVKWLIGVLFFISMPSILNSQSTMSIEQLKQQVIDTLAKEKGFFALAFKDLSSGKELLINEKTTFHAASTMKTPVMIEIYRQASRNKFSLDDSLTLKNEFKSIVDGSPYSLDSADDSDHELYRHIGEKRTIRELVYQMIIVSSNLATNLIIELARAKKVQHTMRKLGAKDMQVLRGVEDQKAYDQGLNNTTTAYDLMLIFEKIAKGKLVNREACDSMIKILLDQRFNDIIPARLPKDVKVAHKTGSITGLHHDCGIVFLPDGRKYILVILSNKLENEEAAIKAMACVSEMIYAFAKGQ